MLSKWTIDGELCEFTGFTTRGQPGGVLTGNHVNLQNSPPEARLVGWQGIMWIYMIPHQRQGWWGISRESCKLTGFPDQKSCWWGISRESCKFTGFPDKRPGRWAISRESCKFTRFSSRGQAVGVLTKNHVNLQDSLTKGQAGEVSAGNRVNLQDSPPEARLLEYWQGIMWIYRIPQPVAKLVAMLLLYDFRPSKL